MEQDLRQLLEAPPQIKLSESDFAILVNNRTTYSLQLNSYTDLIPQEIVKLMYHFFYLQDPRFKWKLKNSSSLSDCDEYHFLHVVALGIDELNKHRDKSPHLRIYDKIKMIRYLIQTRMNSTGFLNMEKKHWCILFRNDSFDENEEKISYFSMIKLRKFII